MDTKSRLIEAIKSDPRFKTLVGRRTRFAFVLTGAMLVIYFGFIAMIAFAPQWLGASLGGATTVGIPVGLTVIAAALALTGLYVFRANSEFDALTREIVDRLKQRET